MLIFKLKFILLLSVVHLNREISASISSSEINCAVLDTFEKRNKVHDRIIEKGITIANVLYSLKKVSENPVNICSVLEHAPNDLNTIVSLSMLAIAPMATMIARTLPYLEWEN